MKPGWGLLLGLFLIENAIRFWLQRRSNRSRQAQFDRLVRRMDSMTPDTVVR